MRGYTLLLLLSALSTTATTTVKESVNSAGLKIFRQLIKDEPQSNVVFSPLSLGIALHWLKEGAASNTHTSLSQFLDSHHSLSEELSTLIEKVGTYPVYTFPDDDNNDDDVLKVEGMMQTLRLVNSLLHHRDVDLSDSFLAKSVDHLQATTTPIDPTDVTVVVDQVNGIVEKLTEGKIKNLVREEHITEDTRLILLNVLYFKDSWIEPFPTRNTKPRKFYLDDGAYQMVSTMEHTTTLEFADADTATAVILPFTTRSVQMILVKPKIPIPSLLDNQEFLTALIDKMEQKEVNLRVPKFQIESSLDMKSTLTTLGLGDLFVDRVADFSAMTKTGKKELVLGDLIHKSFLEFSEKGCEAAAATAAIMRLTRAAVLEEPPVIKLYLDQPFLYFLRSVEGGVVMFSGVHKLFEREKIVINRTEL